MNSTPTGPESLVELLFDALVVRRGATPDAVAPAEPEIEALGWVASSLDLCVGLQVLEVSTDTLSPDLLGDLFGA